MICQTNGILKQHKKKLSHERITGCFTYILPAYNAPLTSRNIMRTLILVNAPIACPFRPDTLPTSRMLPAIVISEVPRNKILIRFRRPNTEGYQDVVHLRRYSRTSRYFWCGTRKSELCDFGVDWLR